VWQTDRQTDRRTQYTPVWQTDRQTYTVHTSVTDRQTNTVHTPVWQTDRQAYTVHTSVTDRQTDVHSTHQCDRQTDRPALLHDVIDECVEHEYNENRDKDVIYCPYVTDFQQFPTTTMYYHANITANFYQPLLIHIVQLLHCHNNHLSLLP